MVRSIVRLLCVSCLLGLAVNTARADEFSFSGGGSGYNVSGLLFATPSGVPGVEDITGIVGQLNGVAISSLDPGSYSLTSPSFQRYFTENNTNWGSFYDNLLYLSGAPFDLAGLEFQLTNGVYVNLFYQSGVPRLTSSTIFTQASQYYAGTDSVRLEFLRVVAVTPEPSSLILLGSGVVGVAGLVRRRLARA